MDVAIDFGASATKIAIRPSGEPVRLVTFGQTHEYPTAVFCRRPSSYGRMWHIGEAALGYANSPSGHLLTRLKHHLHKPGADAPATRTLSVGRRTVPLVEVIAKVLEHGLAAAWAQGMSERANFVLTHPVEWGDPEKEALAMALARAGAGAKPRFVSEPEAVAAYAVHHGLASLSDGAIAVFDLGAATFDSAVVEGCGSDRMRTLVSGGRYVGGDDFDDALLDGLEDWDADPDQVMQLRLTRAHRAVKEARRAKEKLSIEDSTVFADQAIDGDIEIHRYEFEDAIAGRVDSCFSTFEGALASLPSSVKLGTVVGTGGSMKIPSIREQLSRVALGSGAKFVVPEGEVGPGQVVAIGALHATPPRPVISINWRHDKKRQIDRRAISRDRADIVCFGVDKYAYSADNLDALAVVDAGTQQRIGPAGGGMSIRTAIAGDPAGGRWITGTDNGWVEIWNPLTTLRSSALFGSIRGFDVTAVAVRGTHAAYLMSGQPGAIVRFGSDGVTPTRALPALSSPLLAALIDQPRGLLVVKRHGSTLFGLSSGTSVTVGALADTVVLGAAVESITGLLAVTTNEGWRVITITGSGGHTVGAGSPRDDLSGPIALIRRDAEVFVAVSVKHGNEIELARIDGTVEAQRSLTASPDQLISGVGDGRCVIRTGDVLSVFEMAEK